MRTRTSLLLALIVVLLWPAGRALARPLVPPAHLDITVWQARPDGSVIPLPGAKALLAGLHGEQIGLSTSDGGGLLSLDAVAGVYTLTLYIDGYQGTGRLTCGDSAWDTSAGAVSWGGYQALVENPLVLDPGEVLCREYVFTPVAPLPPATPSAAGSSAQAGTVHITIDDGYLNLCDTVRLVNSLGIHATFFLTGQAMLANPECVRLLVRTGNQLGNHTFAHETLTGLSRQGIINTLQATENAAQSVAGVSTKPWCRPPGGAVNAFVRQVAADWGCTMVLWNRDTRDWSGISAAAIESAALPVSCRGEIILFHTQAYARDQVALPDVVGTLRRAGCTPILFG